MADQTTEAPPPAPAGPAPSERYQALRRSMKDGPAAPTAAPPPPPPVAAPPAPAPVSAPPMAAPVTPSAPPAPAPQAAPPSPAGEPPGAILAPPVPPPVQTFVPPPAPMPAQLPAAEAAELAQLRARAAEFDRTQRESTRQTELARLDAEREAVYVNRGGDSLEFKRADEAYQNARMRHIQEDIRSPAAPAAAPPPVAPPAPQVVRYPDLPAELQHVSPQEAEVMRTINTAGQAFLRTHGLDRDQAALGEFMTIQREYMADPRWAARPDLFRERWAAVEETRRQRAGRPPAGTQQERVGASGAAPVTPGTPQKSEARRLTADEKSMFDQTMRYSRKPMSEADYARKLDGMRRR